MESTMDTNTALLMEILTTLVEVKYILEQDAKQDSEEVNPPVNTDYFSEMLDDAMFSM